MNKQAVTTNLPTEVRSPSGLFSTFEANHAGRDFVVGDIHSEFDLLTAVLAKASFDVSVDRVFALGDLVDRGPEPLKVLALLDEPWFFAVRGNHDQWCIDGESMVVVSHLKHGGQWFYSLDDEPLAKVAATMRGLPVAIEVPDRQGNRYGLVHAGCPVATWPEFVLALSPRLKMDGRLSDADELKMLHRMGVIQDAMWMKQDYFGPSRDDEIDHYMRAPIPGIHRIFAGHNGVRVPVQVGNVMHLDTGSCFKGGSLTLMQIDTLEFFSVQKDSAI